jgi:DNA-binding NarL/FixJ family response regulator
VAALIAAGCTNAQIARTLRLGEKTVEKHIATIKANLGATSRASITAAFVRAAPADRQPLIEVDLGDLEGDL